MIRSTLRILLLVSTAGLAAGCVNTTTIAVRHEPAYRAEAHTATIEVTATSQRGIDHINVLLFAGPLTACRRSHLPSLFPCRESVEAQTFTCEFSNRVSPPSSGTPGNAIGRIPALPRTAVCPVSRELNSLTLLSYRATAVDGAGKSASTNYISFSGGPPADPVARRGGGSDGVVPPEPPGVVGDLDLIDVVEPPPRGPTVADVLRPMWLESNGSPNFSAVSANESFNLAQRIDIAFLPDADWGTDYRKFSDATGDLVTEVLFGTRYYDDQTYVKAYRRWRQLFSYWAGPAGASNPAHVCGMHFSGWADAARAITDGQAVIHQIYFQDCGFMGRGSAGTVTGNDGRTGYIFVHESGQFLHCMADEYDREGIDHSSCSDPPNTYASLEACQQVAAQYGYPAQWCVPFQLSPGWRITAGPPGNLDIMDGAANTVGAFLNSDWYDTNNDVIQKRMAKCLQGACW